MKMNTAVKIMANCLTAVMLMAVCAVTTARAAGPALQGQLTLRPLTTQDITDYSLTGVQGASGLSTVGKGQPAYVEVLVNNAVTNSDITNIVWTLAVKPVGSAAVLAASPLGTNVPTYKMADRFSSSGSPLYKVPGTAARRMLRPDAVGLYTVNVSVQTASSGSTNLTQNIMAGTYMGINTCAFCHSGGVAAPDKFTEWSQTAHASFFARQIDGGENPATSHYNKNCISCHTVGYDTNTLAVNGGFDDVATQVGWTFPTNLVPGNWAALTNKLKNLANIQCENCHGPGSEHAFGEISDPHSPAAKAAVSVSYVMGNCAQCHDSEPYHVKTLEWNNSRHAVATRTPSGPSRINCVRCHTAPGFKQFIEHAGNTNTYATNTVYEAITCAACHDPHDASNPHQLRAANEYTLPEGTTVTNVGLGALCMTCHHSRNGSASNNIAKYQLNQPTWAGGVSFGVHDSTAGDMVEGVNAITYGKVIPSGSHSATITNVCVGCHMQPVATTHPAFGQAGGHTYSMTYKTVNGGVTNTVDLVDVCVKCHGPIEEFNFARKDYDGDGVIDGVQTEVQHLLDKLSRLVPPSGYKANPNDYVADGNVKTSMSTQTNWPVKFLNAAWNWQFVNVEGSKGVHNAPYAVGVLKASIGDLTGDNNEDGLSDAWQAQYFGAGWASNPNAAPMATPAGDGVPNWLKFSLGLNPLQVWGTIPGGFVWGPTIPVGFVSGPALTNPQATNTVEIFTAAEVAFNTQVGKTYQIQSSPSLNGSFQNLGGAFAGTGGAVSYVTPTRGTTNLFFRVVHTP
jgi:hypothetical protein